MTPASMAPCPTIEKTGERTAAGSRNGLTSFHVHECMRSAHSMLIIHTHFGGKYISFLLVELGSSWFEREEGKISA